jgi:hypothetical protein
MKLYEELLCTCWRLGAQNEDIEGVTMSLQPVKVARRTHGNELHNKDEVKVKVAA